jgi:hypothetical protein
MKVAIATATNGAAHVHSATCRDLKDAKYRLNGVSVEDVESRYAIAADLYDCFEEWPGTDGWEAFAEAEGMRFFPCVPAELR